ncbi:MAG: TonB C-terminal domain-containing protein [Myxococcaceae bacterium]|nr:TonB C-terminal domain-containing protein [Myxococcaceae bacterium]
MAGRTIVNDGTDPSRSPEASRAAAAEAEARVWAWIDDMLAERRAQTGAVDAYFHDLRAALEAKADFKLPLAVDVKRDLEQAVASYLAAAEAYGRTGNPGLDVPDPALAPVPIDDGRLGIARAREQLFVQTSGVRKAIEGVYGVEPVAIVELRQAPDGHLLEATLLQGSGNPQFDREVMASVPAGVAAAPALPDRVRTTHPKEIRTVWAFRGKFILRKKLRNLQVTSPRDAAYLAAMSALSLFSGAPFEESTMDLYVFDLANPGFEVKATLLRQY